MNRKINLIGAAIDACGNKRGASDTPNKIRPALNNLGLDFSEVYNYLGGRHDIDQLSSFFTQVALSTKAIINQNDFPIVVGGDHSCAIGTWSGVVSELIIHKESLGIIWIDAHMDAHTPDSSLTGNIHGMPVATLLGYGYTEFINILNNNPKIDPTNIVLIGIRSFEPAEAELLTHLGVKVYYNFDVESIGLFNLFMKTWQELSQRVDKIGLSVDLDGFDPKFAPGVSTKEPHGIDFHEFLDCLDNVEINQLVGLEITEGNPRLDDTGATMQCVVDIIAKIKTRLG